MRYALCIGAVLALVAGCSDNTPNNNNGAPDFAMMAPPDMAMAPTGDMAQPVVGPDLGCFMNPMTHIQIINACTNAMQTDKTPVLPLLNKDGTLPPLP
jgi:hypothetical protein